MRAPDSYYSRILPASGCETPKIWVKTPLNGRKRHFNPEILLSASGHKQPLDLLVAEHRLLQGKRTCDLPECLLFPIAGIQIA
jgi:hypothetical protein